MSAQPILAPMTPEAYLAWEADQEFRSEYHEGEVFAMAGGTMRHALVGTNVAVALHNALKGRCRVLSSDMRVQLTERRYVYPDASAVCGAPEIGSGDVLLNPSLVVEVLSHSTEAFDRGTKTRLYLRLPSLRGLLLVSQEVPEVMAYSRTAAGGWEVTGDEDGRVSIAALGLDLALAEVYDGVDFGPNPMPQALRERRVAYAA